MVKNSEKDARQLLEQLAKAKARIIELEAVCASRQVTEGTACVSEEEQAEERVRLERARFQSVIDASPVPYALNNEQQEVTYLNPAFIRTFGYDLDDIPTLADWWPRAYPDVSYRQWVANTWQAHLEKAKREQEPFDALELTIRCKDGGQRTAICSASSLTGVFEGTHLVILYDITERKQTERELEQHRQNLEAMVAERTAALEDANRELESFSYSVSHDLRTPLRAIDGFSQILLEDCADRLDDAGKDCLRRIRSNAQHMGTLIDDLLSLSRLTNCELTREAVDLSAMAQAIIEKRQECEPRREVTISIAPDIYGRGDAHLLEIVLDNLLGNAWKYTGTTDNARIAFDATEQGGERAYRVRDNGVGFDMKYAGNLFGSFQRLHKSGDFEGNGIGLATVARIVRRHGGRVWAEAEKDKGATFYFTLGMENARFASTQR